MIQRAVQQEPDNPAYRDSLGWVLFQLGRPEEALVELEKAATKDPDPTILDHLGDVYLAAGESAKAKQAWSRAAEGFQKSNENGKAQRANEKLKAAP